MIDLRLFTVIPGPEFYGVFGVMGGNKTKRIVTIGDQLGYGDIKYLAVKPRNNIRGGEGLDRIIARDSTWIPGMTVPEDDFSTATQALDRDLKIQVVIIDEYHMFEPRALLKFIEEWEIPINVVDINKKDWEILLLSYSDAVINYHPENNHQERGVFLKNEKMLMKYGLTSEDITRLDFC